MICRDCGLDKPKTEYYRYQNGTLRSACKPCCHAYEARMRNRRRRQRLVQSDISHLLNNWPRVEI